MNTTLRKEIIWFAICLILILLVYYFNIGSLNIFAESFLDINVHDTYFVVPSFQFLILLTLFVFFDVYLIRSFFYRFKNVIVNYISLTINLFMIVALSYLISFVFSNAVFDSTTIYPPLSADIVVTDENIFGRFFYVPVVLQVCLVSIQTILAFKTGLLIQNKKYESSLHK